jgi:hypothetical protein
MSGMSSPNASAMRLPIRSAASSNGPIIKMGIARGRLQPRMAEQLADHRQGLGARRGMAGKAVAKVVQPDTGQDRPRPSHQRQKAFDVANRPLGQLVPEHWIRWGSPFKRREQHAGFVAQPDVRGPVLLSCSSRRPPFTSLHVRSVISERRQPVRSSKVDDDRVQRSGFAGVEITLRPAGQPPVLTGNARTCAACWGG